MAETTCGWCDRDVHMTRVTDTQAKTRANGGYIADAAFRCDNGNCNRYSVVTWFTSYNPLEQGRSREPERWDSHVMWSPPPIRIPGYPDVPEHIAKAAREAWLCHSHGAYIASSAVARSVIEAAAKRLDITVYGIKPKIDELVSRGLVRGDMGDSAHIVRQFGNDSAHGDVLQPPTEEEARDVLDIVDELLHQLFSSPARLARLRESRAERRSGGGE